MFFPGCSHRANGIFKSPAECEQFDFTLEFEQSILVIGVSALFLISIPLRVKKLLGQEERSFATRIYQTKLVSLGSMRLFLKL
jgi:hypothetical protein